MTHILPRLVSWGTALGVIASLAVAALSVLRHSHGDFGPVPLLSAPQPTPVITPIDTGPLFSATLFGQPPRAVAESSENLDVQLVGLAQATQADQAFAFLRRGDETVIARIGTSLGAGIKLAEIAVDHVILTTSTGPQRVGFETSDKPRPVSNAPVAAQSSRSTVGGAARLGALLGQSNGANDD